MSRNKPTGEVATKGVSLHDRLIVFDGLIVSSWSRSVFDDMGRGGLTAANCTCSVWEGFQATMTKHRPLEEVVPRARRPHPAGLHGR